MNDDFLTQYYQPSPPAFSRVLYNRISRQKLSPLVGMLTYRNIAIASAILVLAVACLRVFTMARWEKVDIYWVYVTQRHLFTVSPIAYTPQVQEPPAFILSDVKNLMGKGVKLPTWLPEGYKFDSAPFLSGFFEDATILWVESQDRKSAGLPEQKGIVLYIQSTLGKDPQLKNNFGTGWIGEVAPGSFRGVRVNGLSALLVKGDWEAPTASFWAQAEKGQASIELGWDKSKAIQLYWADGEWFYHLIAPSDISDQDLIRMAESAR